MEEFEWNDSGRNLLFKINQAINENGGRLKMASLLMNENLDFFSYKDHKEMDELIIESKRKPNYIKKPSKPKVEVEWNEADLLFLKNNYGIIPFRDLVTLFKRSPRAIMTKYSRIATLEEKAKRRQVNHYKKNSSITLYLAEIKEETVKNNSLAA